MSSFLAKPPSTSVSSGVCPYRCWCCSTIGGICPVSLPVLTTSTPVITWLAVSVANCTLWAGRKPPSPIFITRASGSVVEARAFSFFGPCFFASISASSPRAWATRSDRSRAAR